MLVRRPGPRIRVIGRTDDLLIVKGVKVYPAAIRNLVQELAPLATGDLRIVLDAPRPRVEPPLRISVERAEDVDDAGAATLAAQLGKILHQRMTVRPGDHGRGHRDLRAHLAEGEADRAGVRDRRPDRLGRLAAQQPVVLVEDDDAAFGLEQVEVTECLREREERLAFGDVPQRSSASSCAVEGRRRGPRRSAPCAGGGSRAARRRATVALDGMAMTGQEQVDVERRRPAQRVDVERERG